MGKVACEVWKQPPNDDVYVILSNLYRLVNCPEHGQVQPAASPKKNMTNSFWVHNPHLCSEWVMTCGLLCHHFLPLFMPADLWVQVEGVHMQTLPPINHGYPILRKRNILIIVSHVWLTFCWNTLNNDEFWAGRTRPTRVPLLKYNSRKSMFYFFTFLDLFYKKQQIDAWNVHPPEFWEIVR